MKTALRLLFAAVSPTLSPTFAAAALSTPSEIDFVLSDCQDVTASLVEKLLAAPSFLAYKQRRVFLYQKCGSDKWLRSIAHHRGQSDSIWQFGWPSWLHVSTLPNIGFEAHTYLHHIAAHYDDCANITLFLHGDLTAHGPILTGHMNFSLPLTWLVTGTGALPTGVENVDTETDPYRIPGLSTDDLPVALARADVETKRLVADKGLAAGAGACSAMSDMQLLLRDFWPQFDVKFKQCYHPPQGAQFAVRREAIRVHARGLFERAVCPLPHGTEK